MRIRLDLLSVAVVAPAILALGCGGGSVAPVSGTVTLNGKPLPNAVVIFQPIREGDNLNPGPGSDARTDAQGKYTLKVVGTGQNGAVVGKHRVEISAYADDKQASPEIDRPGAGSKRSLVPVKYNDKSELTFEVPRGGTDKADFTLQSP